MHFLNLAASIEPLYIRSQENLEPLSSVFLYSSDVKVNEWVLRGFPVVLRISVL